GQPMAGMGRLGRLCWVAAFSAPVTASQSIPTATCGSATSAGERAMIAIHLRTEMEVFRASRVTGNPVSPPDAYQGGPVRAQGMASDAGGNIWISSFGNNSVYVFKHGNP